MHPILADRRWLGLYLAGWLPVAALLTTLLALSGSTWAEAAAVAVPLVPPFAFACLSSWYLCLALPLRGSSLTRLLGTQAAAGAVSASLWMFAAQGWAALLSGTFPGVDERLARQTPVLLAVGTLLYLLAAALHYVLVALDEQRSAEQRALEVKVLAREAELTALRAQLQPHFLFNSLNSISALTTVDAEGARRMCLLLADFLRRSLGLGSRSSIPLADELSLVASFLAVEKVRFGDRVRFDERIDDETRPCLIPPLLLQPLVENAVSHGIAHVLGGGVIVLEARKRGERLEIAVTNPCDPERPRKGGHGVGLANVRRRLEALYGREGTVRIADGPTEFRVDLSLPAVVPDPDRPREPVRKAE